MGNTGQVNNIKKFIKLGIDIGGTFTDVIALDQQRNEIYMQFKISSTPSDPAKAVIQAIDLVRDKLLKDNICDKSIKSLHHGTTVGTNALIQKKGAKTALLTSRGFRDVLELRRQYRPDIYNLFQKISPPLVSREFRIGIEERIGFNGDIITPLNLDNLKSNLKELTKADIESIAVCTIHSYANPENEQRIMEEVKRQLPDVYVTCSHEITPEFGEFERSSTTVVNAYIGPTVSSYVKKIEDKVIESEIEEFLIVKSNGGLTSSVNSRKFPVNFIESGPAAGVTAALHLGRKHNIDNIIAFDMGGTTAKVGVIKNGAPRVTTEFYADQMVDGQLVGGYPIKSPVIDIVEIGVGGGSIAWLDEANVLKVGPESAGADPGPACYGLGGKEPTITDAYVALGVLDAKTFNLGSTAIYPELAINAIEQHIAKPLGWSVEKASYAIIDIASANMAEMIRLVTVRRGLDPKDFVLFSSGGAASLYSCHIAREVGISNIIIPPLSGLLSAFGTMVSDIRHDLVQTHIRDLCNTNVDFLKKVYFELEERGYKLLKDENVSSSNIRFKKYMDLRFKGQVFEFPIEIDKLPKNKEEMEKIEISFRRNFEEEYGYNLPDTEIEIVNFRIEVDSELNKPDISLFNSLSKYTENNIKKTRKILSRDGSVIEIPEYFRSSLPVGIKLEGPAVIENEGSTIYLEENNTFTINDNGFIKVNIGGIGSERDTIVTSRTSKV